MILDVHLGYITNCTNCYTEAKLGTVCTKCTGTYMVQKFRIKAVIWSMDCSTSPYILRRNDSKEQQSFGSLKRSGNKEERIKSYHGIRICESVQLLAICTEGTEFKEEKSLPPNVHLQDTLLVCKSIHSSLTTC